MATSNTKVGPTVNGDGAEQVIRAIKDGSVAISDTHGRYYEACYRSQLFFSNCTAKTLTASNTTATGHILWNSSNQTGSGVNLVLLQIGLIVSVTSASMTGIALGGFVQAAVPGSATAATQVGNCKLGAVAAQGLSYAAATIANAQTNVLHLLHNTAAINTVGVDSTYIDIGGAIIVPPGYGVSLVALGAASASSAVTSSILWEEVPV